MTGQDAKLRAESPRQGRVFALAAVVQAWLLFARQPDLISGLHAMLHSGPRASAVCLDRLSLLAVCDMAPFTPSLWLPHSLHGLRNQGEGLVSVRKTTGLWDFCVF